MESDAMKAYVAVSRLSFAVDKPFSYLIPNALVSAVKPGTRVVVPFGRMDKRRTGIVLAVGNYDFSEDGNIKKIISVPDPEPVLNSELLSLVHWLKENTFCTYYDGVKCMVPSGMNVNVKEHYSLNIDITLQNPEGRCLEAYEAICKSKDPNRTVKQLKKKGYSGEIDILTLKGYLNCELKSRYKISDSTVSMVRLTEKYLSNPESFSLTEKQRQLAEVIASREMISSKEACYEAGVGKSVINKLLEKTAAEKYELEYYRTVKFAEKTAAAVNDIKLTECQYNVYKAVKDKMDGNGPACFLLHGVTGSGKTSVYKKLIYDCVNSGKQAILLIPEISLTPQTVRQFQEIFGELVAVIHSGLSQGQRMDEYKRIRRGLSKIVIGTRSAVFVPFEKIGIIIADEEGERSYKSDSTPRYNAIDVAKERCRNHRAVLLLASATPSIESYYYAQKGVYTLVEMKERYSKAVLPKVDIVDMNIERERGNTTEFSRALIDEINENLKKKEQTILLLNRRGYHTIISCCSCHAPIYCKNCSVPMTYHKANNTLMCHYCGYVIPPVEKCPECGETKFKEMGFGTQKLEEEINKLFPSARVLRMDADTTMSRFAYEKNFSNFGEGKYDIMVGTQMIGKGLDFPNVTLVGVLSVDKALFTGDFRSYERTFSLVAQVVGRCGRGEKKGRAYLQTFMPEHYVLKLAAMQDYEGFYREEISVRKALIFPPVCDILVFGVSSEDENRAESASRALLSLIRNNAYMIKGKIPLRVLGPVKCSYGRINGKYRYRIILKCKNTSLMRKYIKKILYEANELAQYSKVKIYADMNGDIGV